MTTSIRKNNLRIIWKLISNGLSLLDKRGNQMTKERVTSFYHALCKDLGITPLPLKFERVGRGGAAVSFNPRTNTALYMSFDLGKVADIEYAVIHELAHHYHLLKSNDPALKHNAKFRAIENKFVDKYMYSKFTEILWK